MSEAITRRQLLLMLCRLAPAFAGAGLAAPFLRGFAYADGRLEEILRTAPKARYGTSVALAGLLFIPLFGAGQTAGSVG